MSAVIGWVHCREAMLVEAKTLRQKFPNFTGGVPAGDFVRLTEGQYLELCAGVRRPLCTACPHYDYPAGQTELGCTHARCGCPRGDHRLQPWRMARCPEGKW